MPDLKNTLTFLQNVLIRSASFLALNYVDAILERNYESGCFSNHWLIYTLSAFHPRASSVPFHTGSYRYWFTISADRAQRTPGPLLFKVSLPSISAHGISTGWLFPLVKAVLVYHICTQCQDILSLLAILNSDITVFSLNRHFHLNVNFQYLTYF